MHYIRQSVSQPITADQMSDSDHQSSTQHDIQTFTEELGNTRKFSPEVRDKNVADEVSAGTSKRNFHHPTATTTKFAKSTNMREHQPKNQNIEAMTPHLESKYRTVLRQKAENGKQAQIFLGHNQIDHTRHGMYTNGTCG